MKKVSWTKLVVLDENCMVELGGQDLYDALTELFETGAILGCFLERTEDQSEDLDPSEWGPADDEIDWTGFVPAA